MDFTVSDDLARQILALTKTDSSLATALAQQLLKTIEPQALHAYLLTPEVALNLLTQRLKKQPERTLEELSRLAQRVGRRATARGDGARRGPAASAVRKTRRYRKRQRLSPEELGKMKSEVTSFLARHPWANRKQITEAARIPTQAIYNRIIAELKHAGQVISRGEKSKTVYSIKGAAAPKASARGVTSSRRAGQRKAKSAGKRAGRKAKRASTKL